MPARSISTIGRSPFASVPPIPFASIRPSSVALPRGVADYRIGSRSRRSRPFTPPDSRGELLRENQQQMIAMTADVSGRSLGAVMDDVKRVISATPPPAGMRLELGGQYASQQDAFKALLLVLVLAGASVVGVMVIQFQSFVEPLVVLLAAPLSFVGAMTLLLITGTPLNVSSFMGLILLVGPHREERNHPARLHASSNARRKPRAR